MHDGHTEKNVERFLRQLWQDHAACTFTSQGQAVESSSFTVCVLQDVTLAVPSPQCQEDRQNSDEDDSDPYESEAAAW